MRKVEELTLYLIEQNKQIEQLKNGQERLNPINPQQTTLDNGRTCGGLPYFFTRCFLPVVFKRQTGYFAGRSFFKRDAQLLTSIIN